jgi:cell division GTPase FtsZ
VKKLVEEFDRIPSEMEIRHNLTEIVKEYYEERADITIMSFGDCGKRILGYMMPDEIPRANIHSVTMDNTPVVKIEKKKSTSGLLTKKTKMSYFKVDLESKNSVSGTVYSGPLMQELLVQTKNISVLADQFESSPELVASQIFDEILRSQAFILVSGFGGSFGQRMHIAFSGILNKRNIAHVNLVIKPSKLEEDRRRKAQAGIIQLVKQSGGVKVYDNEESSKEIRNMLPQNPLTYLDKINEKVVRDLKFFSLRLSEVTRDIRKNLF